ncbi:transmembrane protein 267 isoform X1 [Zootermopsis nevadensis]|nr:transmembrane protein 267 isoform X1 [Zootermopsis nevadensis]
MLWMIWMNRTVATLCVGLVALLGDHVVAQNSLPRVVRAVADNFTHGAVGLLSWHIVTVHLADLSVTARLWEVLLCGLLASAIDLDHFAAARSLRIEDALRLSSRPFLHCTSVPLAVSGIMVMVAHIFCWPSLHRLSWIFVVAILSHHLRDAARRGLWLYPFGSIPPIPSAVYIVSCMLLPHLLPWLGWRTRVVPQPAPMHSVVVL